MNNHILKKFLPLNSLELQCKNLFQNHPELLLDTPSTLNYLDDEINKLEEFKLTPLSQRPKDILLESLIPSSMDVGIIKHTRYSPAFLHSHDFFEIVYILNGSCKNHISSETIFMKKGDICIIAPNTIHAISSFSDHCIIINIAVRTSTFENAFWGTLVNKDILSTFFSRALYAQTCEPYILFKTENDKRIEDSILNMYDEFQSNLCYSNRMMNVFVTSFFITLLRYHGNNITISNPTGNNTDANIIAILNYIVSNYQTITLKNLSIYFNYSERQMARILKDYTGQTFTSIVHNLKIQKAYELLVKSEIPIKRIMDIVGYSNTSNFYSIFKEKYNMTPSEYRNKLNFKS